MYSKQYLLFTILFAIVVLSASADQDQRKNDGTMNSRKNVGSQDKDDDDDEVDDIYSRLPAYAYGRYPPFTPPEMTYRPRSRWPPLAVVPSSYEFLKNRNNWSRNLNPNTMPPSLPMMSSTNNPMFTSGSTCNSLIDSQYPIFSDMCGAVPQARYSLPNSFGHYDRWQIAHILTTLIGSTTDSVCIRSLRHLLCPMLFQPCRVRYEPPLVLPCQHFCRAVKAQCGIPALDVIPCDALPHASDVCPNIQIYGASMPSGSPSAVNEPSTENAPPPSDYQTAGSHASFSSRQGLPSTFNSAMSPSTISSMQTPSPVNFYNRRPYTNEGVGNVPPRSYTNDYRQGSKFTSMTYPSMKAYPTVGVYPSSEVRFASGSFPSVVKV
ncbi:unnamed protein product [Rotaria sordida]|uniref:FZ domain-containing protein n=1 Tax=Rotaria sordida TaxID=392033 RepID=A0A820C121_9BILA|nr:unnamed protein product [Rotaria sordida]CAF4208785.1 unnamed protein product [Rotaria sordida]